MPARFCANSAMANQYVDAYCVDANGIKFVISGCGSPTVLGESSQLYLLNKSSLRDQSSGPPLSSVRS